MIFKQRNDKFLFVGTSTERLANFSAPLPESTEYFETNTGNFYRVIKGSWQNIGGGGGGGGAPVDGEIFRTDGLVSSVVTDKTYDITRDTEDLIESVDDGTYLWTFTRVDGVITEWAIS